MNIKKLGEDVEKPSLDAFGITILAVMSYQTTPWEELAKKPSIRKTLKYVAIRGGSHYDEIEALTKNLMQGFCKTSVIRKGVGRDMNYPFLFLQLSGRNLGERNVLPTSTQPSSHWLKPSTRLVIGRMRV